MKIKQKQNKEKYKVTLTRVARECFFTNYFHSFNDAFSAFKVFNPTKIKRTFLHHLNKKK